MEQKKQYQNIRKTGRINNKTEHRNPWIYKNKKKMVNYLRKYKTDILHYLTGSK